MPMLLTTGQKQAQETMRQENLTAGPQNNASKPKALSAEDLSIQAIPQEDQVQKMLALLDKYVSCYPEKMICGKPVAERLNFFGDGLTLTSQFPVTTILGRIALAEKLMVGLGGETYQPIIKYLVEHPKKLQRLELALKNIDEGIGLYLTYFNTLDDTEQKTFDSVYFGPQLAKLGLNKSSTALSFLRAGDTLGCIIAYAPLHWLFSIPQLYSIWHSQSLDEYQNKIDKKVTSAKEFLYYLTNQNTIKKFLQTTILAPCKLIENDYNMHFKPHDTFEAVKSSQNKTIEEYNKLYEALNIKIKIERSSIDDYACYFSAYGVPLILDIINALRAKAYYHYFTSSNAIFNNLQTRLIGVAKIIQGLKEIYTITQQSNIPEFEALAKNIKALLHDTSDIKALIDHLKTETFKNTTSYWSNRARILAAHTLMNEQKTAFIPALQASGTIDALHAAAKLYSQHQNQNARYCFVTTINDQESPELQLNGFWNPLLTSQQAVLNDVALGNNGDRNMLLTGPNGNGKSINMKGIALNIILGQTFGIAAAESMNFTPFSYITIYMNEKENLAEGLSTFMAEDQRFTEICNQSEHLSNNEKSFIIMDEMLKGTVEDVGARYIYKAGQQLANNSQIICIMATHFEYPTQLEAGTSGKFINYHVGLEEPVTGKFIRTFKLVRGANLWWFHDKNKRTRFTDWLTNKNV